MKKENLLNTLKAAEEKQHYIIEKASIDKIFLKQSENFINLKQQVAISIWFEEECTFSVLKEGGFILHKPSGDLTLAKKHGLIYAEKQPFGYGEMTFTAIPKK